MLQSLWRSQRLALLLGLITLLLLAGACGDDDGDEANGEDDEITRSPQTPIVIPAAEPIVIGISTALTGGPVAERGEEYRDAAITAIERWKEANGDEIGGHEMEVRAEDDGCSASDVTEVAAQRLLRVRGLVGVIGPQCSSGALAVIPIYDEAGVVMISGSATTTSLTEEQPEGGFFFRTAYRNDLEGTLIGLFLTGPVPGIESVYFVDDGEAYGEDLASNALEIAEAGGVLVMRESIVQGTVDFSDTVARIVEANPGFVGFAGFNPEAALLFRQLRDGGYEGVIGAGDGAASVIGFVEPLGELAEGVLFAGCGIPLPEEVLGRFVDVHGHEPAAAFPAQYVDAATILLNAVSVVAVEKDDGSLEIDPIALRDAVRSTVLSGVSGGIAFDENGDRIPPGVASLPQFVDDALENQDTSGYTDLGLIPCQVQDGRLVNLLGLGAGEIRLP